MYLKTFLRIMDGDRAFDVLPVHFRIQVAEAVASIVENGVRFCAFYSIIFAALIGYCIGVAVQ
jgi:hypothetical protein